jgi:2-methylisocitrate lyase-like PEP mutase family enzyme
MADRLLPDEADGFRNGRSAAQSATVLVVGGTDAATRAQAALMGGTTVVVPFSNLDAALLARLCPEWVVFPLMTTGADAPLVIETLAALGYSGRACVVAPHLPNRRMVEVELRSIAPTLNLMLVEAAE